MKHILSILLLVALLASSATAQQNRAQSFEEMQRRMMEMQEQMMKRMQNGLFGDGFFQNTDTSFFFRFDTSFSTNGFKGQGHFFRYPPADSTGSDREMGDFWGFDQMFKDFFNFGQTDGADKDGYQTPKDDGNMGRTEDDLLPEERLRAQEQQQSKGKGNSPSPGKAKTKDKKPAIETIRI